MFFKFSVYLKTLVDYSILLIMGIFVLSVLIVTLASKELSEQNIGVVFALFAPLLCIGIFTMVFSKDDIYKCSALIGTYKESSKKIFCNRYILSLFLFTFAMFIALLVYNHFCEEAQYHLYSVLVSTMNTSFLFANFSILLCILSKRLDIGMLAGFISFLATIRIPIPFMVFTILFPCIGVVLGSISLIIYMRGEK